MEAPEYEVMYNREEDYWWYVGLHNLVLSCVRRFCRDREAPTVLDAGCGTGKLLEKCKGLRTYGMELSDEALPFLRRRGLGTVVQGTICQIPFPDAFFDVVCSLDVLCCVESPGDLAALREMRRVLKPDGLLLLNLPAYPALRSEHDVAVHIKQRYTRAGLLTLLAEAGLEPEVVTYRNTFLFPVAAAVRGGKKLFRRTNGKAHSDLRPLPALVNRALIVPLGLENRLIRAGVSLPFGLSLFCQATRRDGFTVPMS